MHYNVRVSGIPDATTANSLIVSLVQGSQLVVYVDNLAPQILGREEWPGNYGPVGQLRSFLSP